MNLKVIGISIRRARVEDAEAMAQLAGELGYTTPAEIMQRRVQAVVASEMDLLLVAERTGGGLAGWLQAHAAHIVESGFRVEITGLIVAPDTRRQGVGRLLVAEAERWARTKSAEAIVVRSNAARVESHAFYPALGFRCTKTQLVYRKELKN